MIFLLQLTTTVLLPFYVILYQIRDTAQSYENQSVNVMRDVLKARSLKNGEVVNSNGVTYSSSSSSSNRNNFNHHSSQEYSNRVDRLRTLDSGPRRFDERDDEEDDCVELVKSDDERHTRHNFEGNQLTKVQGLSLSDDREFDDDVINKSSNTRSHRQKKLSPFIDPSKPDKRRRQSTSSSRKRKDHPSMDDFIVDDEEEIEEYSDDCEDVQSGSDSTYDADNDDINRSSRNIRKEKEKTPTKKKQKTDSHSIAHSARKKVGSRLSPYESYDTHFAENDPPLEEIYEITDDATNITSADMSKREFQRKDGESDERFLIRQKRVEAYRDPSKAVDPPSLNPYERLTTGVSSHSNPHGLFNEVINSNSSSKSILSTVGNIVDGARRCVENAAVIGYSMVSGPKRVEEKQSCSSALNTQNDENTKDILFVNPYFANPNAIIDLCTDKENDEI